MKYLKRFETVHTKPKVGDYVICEEDEESTLSDIKLIINNNVGKVVSYDSNNKYQYDVLYDVDIPEKIESQFIYGNQRQMKTHEIIYWADNKEELEVILNANKYNL